MQIDTVSLKEICAKFIRDLNYRPGRLIQDDNASYRALKKEFAQYNTAAWFDNMCREAAAVAEFVYPDHSEEIRIQIAKYSWFIIYVDDMGQKTPENLKNFQRCILKGTSEPETEFFQAFPKHLDEYYRLFDPIPANCIALCAMDFINGCLLEEMPKIKGMKLTDASLSWPYFLRNKTGAAQAYAFMLFPKEVNVDMTTYIQVVEDIALYLNLTNDILSFYKEHMAGERHNYICNRAAATQRSIEETLRDVVKDAMQAHSRVTRVLESSGNRSALDIWGKCVNGFFGFHFSLKRYRLEELDSSAL
ncbi:hypothetical protein D9613_006472 [Agrocybe pediades]|uniref:Terpene synthase n=1 Tax=Agrocybe pediades TaxID=84607 RepID=A0A8H4QIJ4_9AGAR|nr:hypothetical protein D9613_006472 [Agrocybe pediades]